MPLYLKTGLILLVVLAVFTTRINSKSLSIYEQKKYKQLIDGQGLYGGDDDVEILTVHNYKQKLYGQKHAWIVEFYNSWCGFCQRFAPSWKALASDIKGWRNMIKVGAMDCSDEDNSPVCRDFEIMAYPTLRYFHENYEEGPKKLGTEVQKGDDVNSHRQLLIKKIISEQSEGRGQMYPSLTQYTQPNLNLLFSDVPLNTKYVFMIFENGTYLGPEVALDLAQIPQIAIKSTNDPHSLLAQALKIHSFPNMIVLSDQNKSQMFAAGLHTRESFKMAIFKFLQQNEIVIPEIASEGQEKIYTGKWAEAEVPDSETIFKARERKAQLDRARSMHGIIFQMDLENAVRISLKNEVGKFKIIKGERRQALLDFLNVLIKYFQFGISGERFLIKLMNDVESKDVVDGGDIKAAVEKAEQDGHVFNGPPSWLGCEASIPGHRGFPCGLWTLFHYLTVNTVQNKGASPREVLNAMHGFIKNYFGCADCSQHFQEMAKRRKINEVYTTDDAILWLWGAHNEVNKRLAGDSTEDPQFPKVQFPKKEHCSTCRLEGEEAWNFNEVLKYLNKMYSSQNVEYLGTKAVKSNQLIPDIFETSGSMSFMRGLDASMCFILYVASFLLLVILIRLFLKRGYRKKMYVHDILGKV